MTRYYFIEREYVGPNRNNDKNNRHVLIIQNFPGKTNMSYEEREMMDG